MSALQELRITFVADTHLGFDFPAHPRPEANHRGEEFFANFERVVEHVLRSRPHALVHGGDVFDTARARTGVIDRAFNGMAEVANAGIPVVVVPGNHDRSRLPQSLWRAHPAIHVLEQPAVVQVEGGLRAAIVGLPFIRGDIRPAVPRQLGVLANQWLDADVKLLCIHQAVAGARVGHHNFEFRRGPQVLDRRRLPGEFSAVLAGHIHKAQVLDHGQGPSVIYAGSTERTSFAERDEPKGFFDLTFAGRQGAGSALVERDFVNLPARPMAGVVVPHDLAPLALEAFLRSAASRFPENAVVRIDCDERSPNRPVLRELRSATIRRAFPPSSCVQLSGRIIRALA